MISMFDEQMIGDKIPAEVQAFETVKALEKRLQTYIFFESVQKSSLFPKRMETAHQYFYVLAELAKGRSPSSLAKELGLHHSIPVRWMQGQLPDLIQLAIQIPPQEPKTQHKWLPLRFEGKFTPAAFIEVPVRVHDLKQISTVLNQLSSIQTDRNGLVKSRLYNISHMEAFAYILGLLLSRSEKQGSYDSPMKIVFSLPREYSWAKKAGEMFCSLMGLLGIHASQIRGTGPEKAAKKRFSWRTGSSSLITWMLRSVLGIKEVGNLSSLSKYASWLYKAPFTVQLKFIQALFDGAGSASVSSQVVSLTCRGFEKFTIELLKTVGVESAQEGHQLRIRKTSAINCAAVLPIFWQSITRQKNIEKLSKMLAARQGKGRKAYSPQIVKRIQELAKQGLAFGAIAEKIFDELDVSLPKTTVRRLTK